jgi:serine/threonine protein kinase
MGQIFRGLELLSQLQVVHTDIKPENILLDRPITEAEHGEFNIRFADFGSASFIQDGLFSRAAGTAYYSPPEMTLELDEYDTSVDIWAAGIICFELVTGYMLFDLYNRHPDSYDVSGEALNEDLSFAEPIEMEIGGTETVDRMSNGSYDSDSSDESTGDSNDEREETAKYFMLLEKVLGRPPKYTRDLAKEYYNSKGRLIGNPKITHTPIKQLLIARHGIPEDVSELMHDLISKCLMYHPDARLTPIEGIEHPFCNV